MREYFVSLKKQLLLGIIQKQALRSAVANYVGVGFGAFSRLVLALFATNVQIGILDLLDAVSGVFSVVFNFGYNQVLIRLFPKYRNEETGHAGFLMFGIFLSLIGAAIAIGVYLLLFDFFLPKENGEFAFPQIFILFIPPLILMRILFKNLDGYARMLFATVLGTILESLLLKIITFAGIILTFLGLMKFSTLLYVYIFALSFPGLVITLFAFFRTRKIILPSREFISENKRDIPALMFFGVLVGASGSIIMYVDKFMLNEMVGTDAVGVYGQMFFAALLISMVSRGVKRISVPVLAESWKEEDHNNIQAVYHKSCLNQMIIGFFFFLIGWICIEPATDLLGKYHEGIYAFFFLGIGQLADMATGVNAEIIGTSKYYKFNTYFNLVLAFLVIVLNFIFIRIWDITGAAFASCLAMILINFLRWLFLKKVYGLQPFDLNFLKAILPGMAFVAISNAIDFQINPLYEIIASILIITVVYWGIIIGMKVSPDINDWLKKVKRRFLK